jgi:hypothetical protein
MRAAALTFALLSTLAFVHQATAQDRTFGGYQCKDECEGHSAGYKWAERKGIDDKGHCPYGNSKSFHEGCLAYVEDPARGPYEDDDGNPVGVPVTPPEDR